MRSSLSDKKKRYEEVQDSHLYSGKELEIIAVKEDETKHAKEETLGKKVEKESVMLHLLVC